MLSVKEFRNLVSFLKFILIKDLIGLGTLETLFHVVCTSGHAF